MKEIFFEMDGFYIVSWLDNQTIGTIGTIGAASVLNGSEIHTTKL